MQLKLSSDASPIDVATSISYLPFGPMTRFTHSNGVVRTKAYDTDFWLSSIVTGSFQDLTYDYNDRGEVTSIVFRGAAADAGVSVGLHGLSDCPGEETSLNFGLPFTGKYGGGGCRLLGAHLSGDERCR